jgi:hypothetical protein
LKKRFRRKTKLNGLGMPSNNSKPKPNREVENTTPFQTFHHKHFIAKL